MKVRAGRVRATAVGVLAFAFLAIAATAVVAQTAPEPVVVSSDVSGYPRVSLLVDVPPEAGDLSSLQVIEAGARREAEVTSGAVGRHEVVLVIDTSGSMAGPAMASAKSAALGFLDRVPKEMPAAVVGFGAHPSVVAGMTIDRGVLTRAVEGLRAGGETALYDALAVGATLFSVEGSSRSIVLISDGGDTASDRGLPEVNQVLGDARVRLFGVQLVTSEVQRAVLEGLATTTRGRVIEATDVTGLEMTFTGLAETVIRQVRVAYVSAADGPTVVEVRLGEHRVHSELALPAAASPGTASVAEETETPAPAPTDQMPVYVGGASIFLALSVAGGLAVWKPRRSLLADARRRDAGALDQLKARAGAIMEESLERRGRRRALSTSLEHAGVALRPGEYVVIVAAVAFLGVICGLFLSGLIAGLIVGGVVVLIARLLLGSRANKRHAALEGQLPDLLQQLTSSLRAGYGVMQAIDACSKEMAAPMADELRRLFTEVQLGRELGESLRAMADRVGGQDFEWVVQAIEINREVGGELVEVLESVCTTIAARNHLRRQVKTLSAQGRLSARILLTMPFAMAVLLSVINPGYLAPFGGGGMGPSLIVVGCVLMVIGWAWLRRLVRPQF